FAPTASHPDSQPPPVSANPAASHESRLDPGPKGVASGDAYEIEFTLGDACAPAAVAIPTSATRPTPASAATATPASTATATPAPAATATRPPGAAAVASAPPPATPQPLQPPEVFAKLFDLALGKARPASTVTAGHIDVAAASAAALQDTATQERYAPRRPNMLPRILSAANDDSFSRRELAALIARDPSLVGNLLKIANSSYYRVSTEPVESVDRAVVMLGTNGIRSLATAALLQPIFRIGGADFPRFPEIAWEHTFRSANAAVPYNFLIEKSDPFAAELLSLVMGLAEIVVFRVTMDQYAKYPRLRPDASVVSALLDTHSASVARLIGASWELSEQTLSGLDGQTVATTTYPTALGRSLYFGRVVGALAVLRVNRVVDDETGKASIPVTDIPETQIDRMWTRLTSKSE
ncbi:MAG TPA: HDOD domain-containing protein, partial [Steroidobacteraceae bacterium]|nr:HDOD domain-containing protein [Steroidobacteraceae bacterium]